MVRGMHKGVVGIIILAIALSCVLPAAHGQAAISTDKQSYAVGSVVMISINSTLQDATLRLSSSGRTYMFYSPPPTVKHMAMSEGEHLVELLSGDSVVASAGFIVGEVPGENSQSLIEEEAHSIQSYLPGLDISHDAVLVNQTVEIVCNTTDFDSLYISVQVRTEDSLKTYRYDTGHVKFIPMEPGTYAVSLINRTDGNAITSGSFVATGSVHEKEPITPSLPEGTIEVSTDKSVYLLGDGVNITVAHPREGMLLTISSEKSSYTFLGDIDGKTRFIPRAHGTYTVLLRDGAEEVISNTTFRVIPLEKIDLPEKDSIIDDPKVSSQNLTEVEIDELEKYFYNKTSNITLDSSGFRMLDSKGKDFKGKTILKQKIRNESHTFGDTLNPGIYNVVVEPEQGMVESIELYDYRFEGNDTLLIGDVDANVYLLNGKRFVRGFAVDPSGLDFTSGKITARARGSELMKCRDFDFSSQTCYGEWEKVADLTPGLEYDVAITPRDPAFIEVGLATINTDRPAYLPGDTAEITIVALDINGYLVPNAEIRLNLTSPTYESIQINNWASSPLIREVARGIYKVNFTGTADIGTYVLDVHILGKDVNNTFSNIFLVKESIEFDILRDLPVTTDPWNGPFKASIRIISKNYTGIFNFTEVLPASFAVYNATGADMRTEGEYTYLTWHGLSSGSEVTYMANTPYITPDLYAIGPSSIEYDGSIHDEERPWYLAVDPIGTELFYERFPTADDSWSGDGNGDTLQDEEDWYAWHEGADRAVYVSNEDVAAGSIPPSGGNHLSLEDCDNGFSNTQCVAAVNVDLSGCVGNGRVRWYYQIDDTDAGEGHQVQYSTTTTNGQDGTWTTMQELLDATEDSWVRTTYNLPSSALTSNFWIRFRGLMNLDNEHIYFDDVTVNCTTDTPPVMTLNAPPAGHVDTSADPASITFNCSATDDFLLRNISLYITDSSNQNFAHRDSCVVNAASGSCQWTRPLSNGLYTWNCLAIDNRSQRDWGNVNRTLRVNYTIPSGPPSVTLLNPGDNYIDRDGNLTVSCSAVDETDLVNISLFTNISGSYQRYGTVQIPGIANNSYTAQFSILNLANKTGFIWNCVAQDNMGSTGTASSSRRALINLMPEPIVVLNSPQDRTIVKSSTVDFNCSASDGTDMATLNLYSNRSGTFSFERTKTYPGTSDLDVSNIFTVSGFTDKRGYVWNCKGIDSSGNEVFSPRNYSFTVDLNAPNVSLTSPADLTIDLDGSVSLTCGAEDNGGDIVNLTLYTNHTGAYAARQTVNYPGGSDTSVSYTFNIAGIPAGTRFRWNCLAADDNRQFSFAQADRSIAIAKPAEHFYSSSASTTGGWDNYANAQGRPDSNIASEDHNGEEILSTYSFINMPARGTILRKYLSIAYYANMNSGDDALDLGYSVSAHDLNNLNLNGAAYTGADTISPSGYPTTGIQNQSYEITGPLTIANFPNLRMRLQLDQIGGNDQNDVHIDSLYFSMVFDHPPKPGTPSRIPSGSVFQGNSVTFNTPWTDDYFLDCYIFSINQGGSWQNSSCLPFGQGAVARTANYTTTITAGPGSLVQWRYYARDSSGVFNTTAIQSFTVSDLNDNTKPKVYNEQVRPLQASANTTFNISATITDNNDVASARAEITTPAGTRSNYSMTSIGYNKWSYLYTGWIGGNYSVLIHAFDGNGNKNVSSTKPRFNVTSLVRTSRQYYHRGETVTITGYGFSPSSTVTFDLRNSTGQSMSGFPKSVSSDQNGTASTTWAIPSSLVFKLGQFTAYATDDLKPSLSSQATFSVIVRPSSSLKVDANVPGGTDVKSYVNDSDNRKTTIVSNAGENYVQVRFSNNLPPGYTLSDLMLGVEHQDHSAGFGPRIYLNTSTGFIAAACSPLPYRASETIDYCSLDANIGSIVDPNSITIRITDANGLGASDFTTIDFAFLYMNISITNTLSVTIDVPVEISSAYTYTDSVNNKAYGGSVAANPPAQQTGTEIDSYSKITNEDGNRWQTTHSTVNSYAYQSFYFKVSQDKSNVVGMVFTWDGYMTERGTAPENIDIYAWDYTNTGYDLIGTVTGSTADILTGTSLPSPLSNYINSNGDVNLLIMTDSDMENAGRTRQDIFTDYAMLTVTSYPILSGYEDINVTAIDGDGISACTAYFTNSTGSRYTPFRLTQKSSIEFYNLTNTLLYKDGTYNLTANCSDTGIERRRDSVMVKITNTVPKIILRYPLYGMNFTINDIQFVWNVTVRSGQPVCDVYIDNVIRRSNIVSNNGLNTSTTINDITDGSHNWKVRCRDEGGLTNTSENRPFFIDTTGPVVSQGSPADGSYTRINNITFTYTPTDFGILNCSLFINNARNSTNASAISNILNSFTVRRFREGIYTWRVGCTDRFGWNGNSSTRSYTVDQTSPAITLYQPEQDDSFIGDYVLFNFSVFDRLDPTLTCNLTINNIAVDPNIAAVNSTRITRTINVGDGTKYWNVTCWDSAFNYNTSSTRRFTVSGPPTVNLIAPPNGTTRNTTFSNFTYYAEDNDGLSRCAFTLDGATSQTDNDPVNAAYNDFNVTNLAEGSHLWSITCFDTGTKSTTAGSYRYTIDRTSPSILLHAPSEGAFFPTGYATFNFTPTDNIDTSLTCSLYIDEVIRTPANGNFQAQNGTFQSRSESGLGTGTHDWYVRCFDDAGNRFTSETRSIDVGGFPTVTLISPANNTYRRSPVTFTYLANDTDGLKSCSLYINGVLDTTNTTIVNGGVNQFTVGGLPEGKLNWSVECFDNADYRGFSGYRFLTIDNTAPVITLSYPIDVIVGSPNVNFNFTVTDNYDTTMTCDLTVNGAVRASGFNAPTGRNIVPIAGLSEGLNHWNVTCRDDSLNVRQSTTSSFTISLAPDVVLSSPADGSVNITGDVDLTFRVNSNNIDSCALYLNGASYDTLDGSEIIPYAETTFQVVGLSPQILIWTVGCTNDDGVSANATNGPWSLHIDNDVPRVSLGDPEHDFNLSLSIVSFNFTAFDDVDDILSCNITINGKVNQSGVLATEGIPTIRQVPGFTVGTYYWNVTCFDGYHKNTSQTRMFRIKNEPTIQLVSPAQGYYAQSGDVNFRYIPSTIHPQGFISCSLYLDGVLNRTVAPQPQDNGKVNNISVSNIPEGNHNWYINCTDYGDMEAVSSSRSFTIDHSGPAITQHSPYLNQVFNGDDITFNFTATDLYSTNLVCNLTIDGRLNQSNIAATSGMSRTVTVQDLAMGDHNWSVGCIDQIGNYNASGAIRFIINAPDLTLNSSDITFNSTNPGLGDSIRISARISNIGGATANIVPVEFFDGIPGQGGVRIGTTQVIPTIDVTTPQTASVAWSITSGLHRIYVLINYSGVELSKANNNATRNISVLRPMITSPPNATFTNRLVNAINFTLQDYTGNNISYAMRVDGAPTGQAGSLIDGVSRVLNVTLSHGTRFVVVRATDYLGRVKDSSPLTLYVDMNDPVVSYIYPTPSDNTVQSSTTVNINVSHAETYPDKIRLYWQGAPYLTKQYYGPYTNFSLTGLSEGIYQYYVELNDSAGNINWTQQRTVRVDLFSPIINLESPAEGSASTSSVVEFAYNVSDASMYVNCSIYVNNVLAATRNGVPTYTPASFVRQLNSGSYQWRVLCTDQLGRTGASETRNLTVSVANPAWSLIWYERFTQNFMDAAAKINLANTRDNVENNVNVSIPAVSMYTMANATSPYLAGNGIFIPKNIGINFSGVFRAPIQAGTEAYVTWKVYVTNQTGDYLIGQSGNDHNQSTGNNVISTSGKLTLTGQSSTGKAWKLGPLDRLRLIVNVFNNERTYRFTHYWDDRSNSFVAFNQFYVLGDLRSEVTRPSSDITIIPGDEFNITCLLNCTYGHCLDTRAYVQYNSTLLGWRNITASGNLVLNGTETNPHLLGNLSGVSTQVFRIRGAQTSENLIRCAGTSTYSSFIGTTTRKVTVNDTLPPTVRIDTPRNNSWDNTGSIVFYYNVTDNVAVDACQLYMDGSLLQTDSTVSANGRYNFTRAGITERRHTWYVSCNDTSSNVGVSGQHNLYVDMTDPSIRLQHPLPGSTTTQKRVTLNFSVLDNIDTSLTCNVTLDSSVIRSNIEVMNGSYYNMTTGLLGEGEHSWDVTCFDGSLTTNVNNINRSETRTFSVFIEPKIQLVRPESFNWTRYPYANLYFNASDDTGLYNCSLILDGSLNSTKTTSQLVNRGISNFSLSGLVSRSYNWAVECYDSSVLRVRNISETRTFYVDLADPIPRIQTQNGTWFRTATPLIRFNITDNMDASISYRLLVDGSQSVAGVAANGTSSSNSLAALADGRHTVVLEGRDEAGRIGLSPAIVIYVDTIKPSVTLINPEDGNITTNNTIRFQYRALDNLAQSMVCNLTMDRIVRSSDTVPNGSVFTRTIAGVPAGSHYWNVTCADIAGNTNYSRTFLFTVPLPDLTLNSTHISFNATSPAEGDNVSISATIFNVGTSDAVGFDVRFHDGNYTTGAQIDDFTISIPAGGNITLNTSWIAGIGPHQIFVVVDPPIATGGLIDETDEDNNVAYSTIIIGSYNVVYGNMSGTFVIQDLSDSTIFLWNVSNLTNSNIYVADYDSAVSWADLQALGRDTSGAYVFNDFTELDLALGSLNFTDSVNDTWTRSSSPVGVQAYTVFANTIGNVPVVNSTVNSNFLTGILWDTVDGGTQFDGSQDVVFVSSTNLNSTGMFGPADFEVKIPSNLKKLNGPNTVAVALYTEIR